MTKQLEAKEEALRLIKMFGRELAIKLTDEIRLELKYKIKESTEREIRFYYWLSVRDMLLQTVIE